LCEIDIYIIIKLANQLLFPIILKSQFKVASIWDNIDKILGVTWMEMLGTFSLNLKKKYLPFWHNKSKIALNVFTIKSCLEVTSSKDIDDTPIQLDFTFQMEWILQQQKRKISKKSHRILTKVS